jgi:hypothetical protein
VKDEEGIEVPKDALDLLLGEDVELQQRAAVGVGDEFEVKHHAHLAHVQLVDGLLPLQLDVAHQAAAQTGHRLTPAASQALRSRTADARRGRSCRGPHGRAQDGARAPQ